MNERIETCVIADPVVVLAGPTAIGKTDLSLRIAREFNGEIISVDSMQVYRYMDIGTAKVTSDERLEVPHHLIDIIDPDEHYNAAQFVKDALQAIRAIHSRGAIPLLTGGTGLYLDALKKGLFDDGTSNPKIRVRLQHRAVKEGVTSLHQELVRCDPVAAKTIHSNDRSRVIRALEVYFNTGVPYSEHVKMQSAQPKPMKFEHMVTIGLTMERNKLYQRINERTALMLEQGLEEEVQDLLARGYDPDLKSMQSIGYRHMIHYLQGDWNYEKLLEILSRDTRRYAKRQFTWFNKDNSILWFNSSDRLKIFKLLCHHL
ncbi:MAG: tRNA (adenosine(37)-N6)-dimethylallyltransferase MiaA [Deltaproteobacteria bacterium]|nr:tRNA (adenosine(37)-N6)-dimethylallyltransferase MiaA [Deltaproteobacteria bacterium]